MIARSWTGRVRIVDGPAYLELMESVAIPDYKGVEGNLGAWCLSRPFDDDLEVTMFTFWRDEQAIEGFAGKPIDRARYYDFDQQYLLDFPETALHYQVRPVFTDTP